MNPITNAQPINLYSQHLKNWVGDGNTATSYKNLPGANFVALQRAPQGQTPRMVFAEAKGIGTFGKTYPLPTYYQTAMQILPELQEATQIPLLPLEAYPDPEQNHLFPLTSDKLTLQTKQSPNKAISGLNQTLAIIGTDPESQHFLQQNAHYLQTNSAIALVVQADSFSAIQQLQQQFPDMEFLPVNGDSIAEQFAINYYPIILTSKGAAQ